MRIFKLEGGIDSYDVIFISILIFLTFPIWFSFLFPVFLYLLLFLWSFISNMVIAVPAFPMFYPFIIAISVHLCITWVITVCTESNQLSFTEIFAYRFWYPVAILKYIMVDILVVGLCSNLFNVEMIHIRNTFNYYVKLLKLRKQYRVQQRYIASLETKITDLQKALHSSNRTLVAYLEDSDYLKFLNDVELKERFEKELEILKQLSDIKKYE